MSAKTCFHSLASLYCNHPCTCSRNQFCLRNDKLSHAFACSVTILTQLRQYLFDHVSLISSYSPVPLFFTRSDVFLLHFAKAECLDCANAGKHFSSELKHRAARHRTEETCVRAVRCRADLSRSPVTPTRLLAAVFSKLCWARSKYGL